MSSADAAGPSATPLARIESDGRRYVVVTPHADRDYIQKRLHADGVPYELAMLRDMRSRLAPGDLVLDIGANIGNHTLYLALVADCRVIAFEPNAALAEALIDSAQRNDAVASIEVRAVALGAERATGHFREAMPDNLGGQSVALGEGDIPVQALDATPLPAPVRAMKIDVEGMELDVLRGAAALLQRDRPLLYVECQHEADFRAVHDLLDAAGYTYWDTFNATPTHLFLPRESVGIGQRLARLQFKITDATYRADAALSATRAQLDQANLRYREVNQKVATLQAELAQQREHGKLLAGQAKDGDSRLQERTAQLADAMRLRSEAQAQASATQARLLLLLERIDAIEAQAAQAQREADARLRTARDDAAAAARTAQAERAAVQDAARAETAAAAQRASDAEARVAALERDLQQRTDALERMARERASAGADVLRERLARSEAAARLEQMRQALDTSRRQTRMTRDSLSFRLGNSLLLGATSLRGFVRLPPVLWRLALDARRQRRSAAPADIAATTAPRPPDAPPPVAPAAPQAPATQPRTTGAPALAPVPPASAALRGDAPLQASVAATLRGLRVAAIMDEFTHASFAPECTLLQLSVDAWDSELEAFRPELLFVESAWRGKDERWGGKVGHVSRELCAILQWCADHGVPTAFWNKEDPVHFETFLNTAKRFEYIFTTDIDCIQRYKTALGHGRVSLLPFAAQPALHNPVESFERKDAFCFAGAYYTRYPDRTRDLGNFVASLSTLKPVEIYDRNFGKDDPAHMFPDEYRPFIVGNLPFSQIDRAYKGYRYAINLNSIKQSQSMFARRVFELLASNTVTVSNFSRGVRLLFGDLVVCTDDGAEAARRIVQIGDGERAFRLLALRKVLSEHTYRDRLAHVVSRIRGDALRSTLPEVVVCAAADDAVQFDRLLRAFERQRHADARLVLWARFDAPAVPADPRIRVLRGDAAAATPLRSLAADDAWLAGFVAADHYGPDYLLDLVLATRFAPGPVLGKAARYAWSARDRLALLDDAQRYRGIAAVPARAGLVRLDHAPDVAVAAWLDALHDAQLQHADAVAVDEFSYCRNGALAVDAGDMLRIAAAVDVPPALDGGLALADLVRRAEAIPAAADSAGSASCIDAAILATMFAKAPKDSRVAIVAREDGLAVQSDLPDGQHEYRYSPRDLSLSDLGGVDADGSVHLHLDATPGLNLQLVVLFLDAGGQRIGHGVHAVNRNLSIVPPADLHAVRLGLRAYGSGACTVRELVLGHRRIEAADLLTRGSHLLLTNHYPSSDDLYRNGFVHRRVVAYRERGVQVDVFRLRPGAALSYHEFEGVDCISGSQEALDALLAQGRHRSVLVHFLDEAMWSVLAKHVDRLPVTVWVHGAEVQPLHRREYNYRTEAERDAARVQSEQRTRFWRELLSPMPARLTLVFVSQYFAEEVMEDLGLRIAPERYRVIHNPIDTTLFRHVPKPAAQRLRLLSIRPFASAKYANDLTVQALVALSRRPLFADLRVHIIGDGPLFEEILAPLRAFDNVTLERRFLSQGEIAALHRDYGVFLCPTRMDAQGVSRDEAMASGLVPVTNAVTAIPEFVDAACGVLAPGEDWQAMADGIEALAQDPERFEAMSAAAARRVQAQSGAERVIASELALIEATLAGTVAPVP